MEPLDVEKLVGELEVAVDRLRSLYDQYFMGIEKLEPTVPRKDVERRIQVLRKEQIRNTAQRFRFQMILQRYNTYQTHWLRICREIENGTYKRHMMRAQQRFGEAQAAVAAAAGGKRASLPPPAKPGAAVLTAELEAELAELDREFAPAVSPGAGSDAFDVDLELEPEPPPRAPVAPAPAPRAPPPPPLRGPTAPPPGRAPVPGPPPAPSRAPLPQAGLPSRPGPPPPPSPVARPSTPHAPAPAPAPSSPARPVSLPPRPAAAATKPPAPAPRPAPTPPARSPDDLPDERVREIYSRYVDAKRRQNESTASITYEAVAKSLRESSAKLRQKHGKAVDFEVTVKDGKTILKPVLK